MQRDPASAFALGIAFLIGCLFGVVICKASVLRFAEEVSVADFASLVLTAIALLLVPGVLARIERRDSFDRRALAERLEPARDVLYEIDDTLDTLISDTLDSRTRESLVRDFQKLRKNIGRANEIAAGAKSRKWLVDELENCAALAGNLNRLATGARPYSGRPDAREISIALRGSLQALLRSLA